MTYAIYVGWKVSDDMRISRDEKSTHRNGRAPRNANTTMHKDIPALRTRSFHPIAHRRQLVLQAINTVVAHALYFVV
jgi:hypothetical protein